MKRISEVTVLENYKLELVFSSGESGVVDLSDLVGKGIFALWLDYEKFREVQIGTTGELIWSDQLDLCPDSLYLRATGKRPEDVFPSLRPEKACA